MYRETVDAIRKMSCMAHGKRSSQNSLDTEIFFIRGTRVSVKVQKRSYWDVGGGRTDTVELTWFFKKKHKKDFRQISFEEVLDSTFISKKAKAELLFHLDVFAPRKGS